MFAKDAVQCIEDCDDENHAGQDAEGVRPKVICRHFYVEEEQLDQREQEHREEEQL